MVFKIGPGGARLQSKLLTRLRQEKQLLRQSWFPNEVDDLMESSLKVEDQKRAGNVAQWWNTCLAWGDFGFSSQHHKSHCFPYFFMVLSPWVLSLFPPTFLDTLQVPEAHAVSPAFPIRIFISGYIWSREIAFML